MGKRKHNVRTQITFSVDISTKDELDHIWHLLSDGMKKKFKKTKSGIVAELIRKKYEDLTGTTYYKQSQQK